MKRSVVVAFALLGLAGLARAEQQGPPPPEQILRMGAELRAAVNARLAKTQWVAPGVIFGLAHGADIVWSELAPGDEANPFIMKHGLYRSKAVGFALNYGADIGIQKLSGRKRWPVHLYRGLVLGVMTYRIQRGYRTGRLDLW